jgi:hypothetical protein
MAETIEQMLARSGLSMQTAVELGVLFKELAHDKKQRRKAAEMVREAKPDSPHAAAFSDIEQDDKFEAFKKEQADRELEHQRQEVLARMNRQRAGLLTGGPDGAGRKYSEDDIKKIEDLMSKKGMHDYDDGATLYAATLPPVEPGDPGGPPIAHGQRWEIPQLKDWAKNPAKMANDQAHKVIAELMHKRRG